MLHTAKPAASISISAPSTGSGSGATSVNTKFETNHKVLWWVLCIWGLVVSTAIFVLSNFLGLTSAIFSILVFIFTGIWFRKRLGYTNYHDAIQSVVVGVITGGLIGLIPLSIMVFGNSVNNMSPLVGDCTPFSTDMLNVPTSQDEAAAVLLNEWNNRDSTANEGLKLNFVNEENAADCISSKYWGFVMGVIFGVVGLDLFFRVITMHCKGRLICPPAKKNPVDSWPSVFWSALSRATIVGGFINFGILSTISGAFQFTMGDAFGRATVLWLAVTLPLMNLFTCIGRILFLRYFDRRQKAAESRNLLEVWLTVAVISFIGVLCIFAALSMERCFLAAPVSNRFFDTILAHPVLELVRSVLDVEEICNASAQSGAQIVLGVGVILITFVVTRVHERTSSKAAVEAAGGYSWPFFRFTGE